VVEKSPFEKLASKYKAAYVGNDFPQLERLPTGLLGLDIELGGGLPLGRTVELYGPESAGKTAFALHMARQMIEAGRHAIYLDLEKTISEEDLHRVNISPESEMFKLFTPVYGEEALSICCDACQLEAGIVIVDSVPYLRPQSVVEKEIGALSVSPIARLLSQEMGRLTAASRQGNTILLFINQERSKVGGYGNPITTPGGAALRYLASVRMRIRNKEEIKGKDGHGIRSMIQVQKSKVSSARGEVLVDILDKTGIDTLMAFKIGAIQEGYVLQKGSYFFLEESLATELGLDVSIGQGLSALRELLNNHPQVLEVITSRVLNEIKQQRIEGRDQPLEELFPQEDGEEGAEADGA
jgi:recombination protein RecA